MASIILLDTPSWQEAGVVISLLMPAVFYFAGKWFDKRKDIKTVEGIEAGTNKTNADSRKIEAEVAQEFIESSKALVAEYKDMLKDMNNKYDALEKRQELTESKLELEIRNRTKTDRLLRELYHGVKVLLMQFDESKTTPKWVLSEKLKEELERLENKEE